MCITISPLFPSITTEPLENPTGQQTLHLTQGFKVSTQKEFATVIVKDPTVLGEFADLFHDSYIDCKVN